MTETDSFECDPNTQDCGLPSPKDYVGAHVALWILCWFNSAGPILYWFLGLKKEVDDDPANKKILERNWWWFDTAWPMLVWGHTVMYGFPAFFGFFTFMGSKGFDNLYKWWLTTFMNFFGTLMHLWAGLAFVAGTIFWINQDLISRVRAWITTIAYLTWTVITFIWIGSTQKKSFTYMYLKHCKDDCYIEVEAEEDEAVEIDEDATTFAANNWDWLEF